MMNINSAHWLSKPQKDRSADFIELRNLKRWYIGSIKLVSTKHTSF